MIVLKHIVSIARNNGRLPFNPFAGYINSPESVDRGYTVSYTHLPVVARLTMAFKTPLRSGDEFVSKLYLKKEGIKYVFYQDIFRLPDMQQECFLSTIFRKNG